MQQSPTAKLVSQRLGISAGSLWHYFDSFDQVVELAARYVLKRDTDRLKQVTGTGLAALVSAAESLLPLDDATRAEASLLLGFWGRLPSSSVAKDELTDTDLFVAPLIDLARAAVEAGELRADTPVEQLGAAINQLLDGAQVSQVLQPDLSAAEQRARLAVLLYPWVDSRETGEAVDRLRAWMAPAG